MRAREFTINIPMVMKIDADLTNTLNSVDDIKKTLGMPIYPS